MVSDAMPVCCAEFALRQAKRLNPLANLIGREQSQMLSQALCHLRVCNCVKVDFTASVTPVYLQLADVEVVQAAVVLDLRIIGSHRRPNLTLAALVQARGNDCVEFSLRSVIFQPLCVVNIYNCY